jgi:predicted NBD/HSP70 family sugar kinase
MLCLGLDIGGTSVKAALLRDGVLLGQHAGRRYERPSLPVLEQCIREAVDAFRTDRTPGAMFLLDAVGLSVPGVLSEDRRQVTYSANVPALTEHELRWFALSAAGPNARWTATTDQIAAATDYAAVYDVRGFRIRGRLLAVGIGTGVGAAVLDFDAPSPLGRPLGVNGLSPGHIGQMDVSLDADPPIGPDGGAGSLEAYLGARALGGRDPATLGMEDAPIRALVRALRICHALYRPDEIALLGGVGIRLAHLSPTLEERINQRLTALARPGWRLGFGTDDFHAARGAARLAAQ